MVEDFMPIDGENSLIGVCGRREFKGISYYIFYILKEKIKHLYFFFNNFCVYRRSDRMLAKLRLFK